MSDKGNGNGQAGSSRRILIIVGFFLIIIVALVGVIAFLLGRNTNKGGSDTGTSVSNNSNENSRDVFSSGRVVLDEDSAANIMDEMRKEVEEGMFECNMSMEWSFSDGSAKSDDAYVANSTNNKYPIYFDVVLMDTNETVYSSPVLPVGSTLTQFALDKDLEPGTYKAKVVYYLIRDEESQEIISSAAFVIKMSVLN